MGKKNNQNKYNEKEWQEPVKEPWPKQLRRQRLKKLAIDIGLYNINKSQLAKDFQCSRSQIYADIRAIVKAGLDKTKLNYATIEIDSALTKVAQEMHKILIKGTTGEKMKAASVLLDQSSKYTDFLEKFGVKDIQSLTTDSKIEVSWGKDEKDKDD